MKKKAEFTGALLAWFHEHKRDLPWRRSSDPYAIWLSEMMLQQTQVKTALPYYDRFLARFPDVQSLANASLQEVLKCWEGLGYYSRARHLHSTAREVRARYGGRFPETREALIRLPGIGPYTASAVASIAFHEATPVVDGNVWRVFSRILADESKVEQGKKKIFEFLKSIIPANDPGSFNQAIMELGSLVCTPKNPNCTSCPVRNFCLAFKRNKVAQFPRISGKKKLPHRNWIALVIRRKNKVLLRQRPMSGIWGGLWEFPTFPVKTVKHLPDQVKDFAGTLALQEIFEPKKMEPIPHTFSHFKLTLHPFHLELKQNSTLKGNWIILGRNPYPMPKPHLKLLEQLA